MSGPAPARKGIDLAIAAALGIGTVVVVGATARDLGFTRDEGYYFKAAELYWGWFEQLFATPAQALSQAGIDKGWGYNHEHPALLKTLFAFGFGFHKHFLQQTGVSVHDAIRFPAWCVAGLSTSMVYALARMLLRRRAALIAALFWVGMPHVFWHMHVACFDIGVCAAHTWTVAAYWRWGRPTSSASSTSSSTSTSQRRVWAGAIAVAVAFALAAACKHNVLIVPALLVVHWLACDAARSSSSKSSSLWRAIPPVFLALALVSPIVYLAHWPWLWPDPLVRFGQYLGYHTHHEHYPILYFGELLTAPPFPIAFPFVMSAVTIPVPVVAAMVVGFLLAVVVGGRVLWLRLRLRRGAHAELELTRVPLGDVARAPSGSPALLLALNAFVPFFLIALPSTPIFGGTKHWMNGLPFLCVLAAWAIEEGAARLTAGVVARQRVATAVVVVAVGLSAALPGPLISARVWPFGLGSYNELIGFARGAASVGMQRTFWGYEPLPALDVVNQRAPRNARIHFGDTNYDDYRMYRRDGLLRSDIAFANTVRAADVASVQPQGEFKQQWIDVRNEWGDDSPDVVLSAEGVPVATITFHDDDVDPARGAP